LKKDNFLTLSYYKHYAIQGFIDQMLLIKIRENTSKFFNHTCQFHNKYSMLTK